jgi:hypothetical protein
MTKVDYLFLASQVEKLFQQIELNLSEVQIEQSIQIIAAFIQACGWDENEYWTRWVLEQEKADGSRTTISHLS